MRFVKAILWPVSLLTGLENIEFRAVVDRSYAQRSRRDSQRHSHKSAKWFNSFFSFCQFDSLQRHLEAGHLELDQASSDPACSIQVRSSGLIRSILCPVQVIR